MVYCASRWSAFFWLGIDAGPSSVLRVTVSAFRAALLRFYAIFYTEFQDGLFFISAWTFDAGASSVFLGGTTSIWCHFSLERRRFFVSLRVPFGGTAAFWGDFLCCVSRWFLFFCLGF